MRRCVLSSARSSCWNVEQPDERRHHKVCPNLHQQSQVSCVCDQGELLRVDTRTNTEIKIY